jgi:septum formation protein
LLEAAGVPVVALPSSVDERAVERSLSGASALVVAMTLAQAKAAEVCARMPGRLVLGADQTLACHDERFHKPADRAAAKVQLLRLSGKTHQLHSGLALLRDGELVWRHVESADLTMRELTEPFVERYLDAVDEGVLRSVGAYQLEGLGIHLFNAVSGDHSTILGLPLLPLLAVLRNERVLMR